MYVRRDHTLWLFRDSNTRSCYLQYIVFDSMTQIGVRFCRMCPWLLKAKKISISQGLFATMLVIHEQLSNICDQMHTTATARALDCHTVRKQRSNEAPHLGGRISPPQPPIEIKVQINTEQSHDKTDFKTDFGYQSGSGPVAAVKVGERESGDLKFDPDEGSDLGLEAQDLHHDDGEGKDPELADDSGSEDSLV